jgi:hypothetical protein
MPKGQRRWLVGTTVALLLVAGAAAVFVWWPRAPVTIFSASAPPPDPRLTYPTRYRNVRPEVEYVREERCADCHADIAAAYRQHPMGRSLAPVGDASPLESYAEAAHNPFDAAGFHYVVERGPGGVFHKEELRDSQGKAVISHAEPVLWALGSGTRGRSYIVQRGQQLYQSPISWYSESKRWDLSPGYRNKQLHFERPLPPGCLFCHVNRVEPIAGTENAYEEPIFRGTAIGCQRCHGPGALHVALHDAGERAARPDETIVNPRDLEPLLRDAVCEQCHLQGETRLNRRDRATFDYRPGLPLHLFSTIFVKVQRDAEGLKSVSQVEQMVLSRCYQKSAGKLGCISCHDPHRRPAPSDRATFFRDRCLTCHGPQAVDCKLSPDERVRKVKDDSCIACHMPQSSSVNIAHTSVTNHLVSRSPRSATAQPEDSPPPWNAPIRSFHARNPEEELELERDLGIVLSDLAATRRDPGLARQAQARLTAALARVPGDVEALDALATVLRTVERPTDALAKLNEVLALAPRRESTLLHAAQSAGRVDHFDDALAYLQRVCEVNPNYSLYYALQAEALAGKRDWQSSVDQARAALKLNPAQREYRKLLLRSLLQLGEKTDARRELAVYELFRTPDAEALRQRLDALP